MSKTPSRTNVLLAAANSAAAKASATAQAELLAQAEADRTISVPAAPPAAVENHRVRFSGYFSKTEAQALSKIRAAFPGDRLPDNLLVRAAVRAAQPDMLRAHLAAIQAEDRRRI